MRWRQMRWIQLFVRRMVCGAAWWLAGSAALVAMGQDLAEVLSDQNVVGADFWIYNDLNAALRQAKQENKPIFVTFRCVPCENCRGFDAEVASGSARIANLAQDKFISVRKVEMKNVDLNLFQFDHDLNWAAMFINADGTVYARYGTQSAEGPDAYNSIQGLETTMRRVLELHENYPANRATLVGKRGSDRQYRDAFSLPGLQNPAKYKQATTRSNCIHCHNIHDAENVHAQQSGNWNEDLLWRYPLPDNLGLKIDPINGRRITSVSGAAAKTSLRSGEEILEMNGQAITSIADMQWVLHHLPNDSTRVKVRGSQAGLQEIALSKGWKKTDISWRGSLWSVEPKLRVFAPPADHDQRRKLGLAADQMALLVKWINPSQPGGQAAKRSGLRQGDIIVAVDGKTNLMDNRYFNLFVKMNYAVGQKLPLTIMRNGKRIQLELELVE